MNLQPKYTYHASEMLERFSGSLETSPLEISTPAGNKLKLNVENNNLCIRADHSPKWFDYILEWICSIIVLSLILTIIGAAIKFTMGIEGNTLILAPLGLMASMMSMGVICKCIYLIFSIINRQNEVIINRRDITYSITDHDKKQVDKSFPKNEDNSNAPCTDLARIKSNSCSFPTESCRFVLKKITFMSTDYSLSLNCCTGKEVTNRYICFIGKDDVNTFVNIMNGSGR